MANYNITMKQLNSSGTYDTLYPATIGSQVSGITAEQISGIYTAEQTLTSSTAALFQLSGDTALPDKVFEILSKAALVGEDGGLVLPSGGDIQQTIIEVGFYTGTGKFGASNPCSLSFKSPPKFVSILHSSDGVVPQYVSGYNPGLYSMAPDWLTTSYVELSGFYALRNHSGKHGYGKKSSNGKTFYWYDTGSAENQLNTAGVKYYYFVVY